MEDPAVARWARSLAWVVALAIFSVPLWSGWSGAIRTALDGLAPHGDWSTRALARAMAGHVAALGMLAGLLLVSLGAGIPLVGWLSLPARGMERVVLALALGWSLPALAHYGMGLAGLLAAPALMIELALGAAAGAWWVWPKARGLARDRQWSNGGLARAAVPLLLLLLFVGARLPDTLEDTMVYHFAAPEAYVRDHRIIGALQHLHWRMPRLVEAWTCGPWALGGFDAAKLLNPAFAIALALVMWAWADGTRAGAGALAACWTLGVPVLLTVSWQGKNDLGAMLLVAVGARSAAGILGGRAAWWPVMLWSLAAAAAAKLTVGFAGLPLLVTTFLVAPRRRRPGAWAVLAAAACPLAGWWIESWLRTGNPFSPFATRLFPDLAWSPELQAAYVRYTRIVSVAGGLVPSEVFAGTIRIVGEGGVPILLLLGPAIISSPRDRVRGGLMVAMACGYGLWLLTERNARFMLPAIPVLAWLAATAVYPVRSRVGAWMAAARNPLAALVVMVTGFGILSLARTHGLAYLLGQQSRTALLVNRYGTWEASRQAVNRVVPRGATILMTGEYKRLGFLPRVVSTPTVAIPPFWTLARQADSVERIGIRLRQTGAGYWLHNPTQAMFRACAWYAGPDWSMRQTALLADFMATHVAVVSRPEHVDREHGAFLLARFTSQPGPRRVPLALPGTEAQFRFAAELAGAGRFSEAWGEARRVAAMRPEAGDGLAAEAYYAARAGAWADAEALSGRAIETGFLTQDLWTVRAVSAAHLGHAAAAKEAYTRAALTQPGSAPPGVPAGGKPRYNVHSSGVDQ